MGKVFTAPTAVGPLPELSSPTTRQTAEEFRVELDLYLAAQDAYVLRLQEWARTNGNGDKYVGEEVSFPQGDGFARYIVRSLKPVQLIHIATGDAWEFPYVERLTASDIRREIDRQRAVAAYVAERKANATT